MQASDIHFMKNIVEGLTAIKQIPDIAYQYNLREKVYQRDKVTLYHYQPTKKNAKTIPLLVVFATVNRPEVLDLYPDHSFIHGLLQQGIDVYLLDWGYADEQDKHIQFNDYVTQYLHACVEFIEQRTKQSPNLLGICQGGVISLCYAILFSSIRNLVLISTPIDFHTQDNLIANHVNKINIQDLLAKTENISGQALTQFFISFRPFELMGRKYLRFIDHLSDEDAKYKFLLMEKWLNDAPDQPGHAFKEFITDFYQQNKLIKNEIYLSGRQVCLNNLRVPVLNIMAEFDEIVPVSATRCLKQYIQPIDYTEHIFKSGHIGLYVSNKMDERLTKCIATWLKKHVHK